MTSALPTPREGSGFCSTQWCMSFSKKSPLPFWTRKCSIPAQLTTSQTETKLVSAPHIKWYTLSAHLSTLTALCPLCEAEDEDRTHFLLSCSKLEEPRARYLPLLLTMAERVFGDLFDDAQNQD